MKIIVADAQKAKRMSEEYVNETSLKHLSEARERSQALDLHDTSVLGFHDCLVTSFRGRETCDCSDMINIY